MCYPALVISTLNILLSLLFWIELFSGHVNHFSYLGARYNKRANDFAWDDGTKFIFNELHKIMPDDPNSCLAIFPQQRSTIDGNRTRWYWEDVKCDEPKAYFICSYTNGNFFTLFIEIKQTSKDGLLYILTCICVLGMPNTGGNMLFTFFCIKNSKEEKSKKNEAKNIYFRAFKQIF